MATIETERLYLRQLVSEDAPAIFEHWASDPQVTRYLTWSPHESLETTRAILDQWVQAYEDPATYRYGIVLKVTDSLIGMIDAASSSDQRQAEIGYVLSRPHWNKGYMTEVLQAVVEDLFNQGYETLHIAADVDNVGSHKVILKAGFIECGEDYRTPPSSDQLVRLIRYQVQRD